MPKVSVIIPVYNVEQWLEEALDSILIQTYKDIEVICINDGSFDNSASILECYKNKDKRIHVITQENLGLSCARNAGIAASNGEYIYFMDSDDKIVPHAIERLYYVANSQSLDILYFDGSSFIDKECNSHHNFSPKYLRSKSYSEVFSGAELALKMSQNREYYSSVCLIFLSREFVIKNQLQFYPKILHEDNLFSFQAFMMAKRVSHINETLFLRRVRDDSIMTKTLRPANLIGYWITYIEVFRFILSRKLNDVEQRAADLIVGSMFNAVIRVYTQLTPDARNSIDWSNYPEAGILLNQIVIGLWKQYMPHNAVSVPKKEIKTEAYFKKELAKYIKNHKRILNSKSFRIGRTITWLPRMVRNTLRSIKQEGIKITFVQKFPNKVRMLLHMEPLKMQKTRRERKFEEQVNAFKVHMQKELCVVEQRMISIIKRTETHLGTQIGDLLRKLSEIEQRMDKEANLQKTSLCEQIYDMKKEVSEVEQRISDTIMQTETRFGTRLHTFHQDAIMQCSNISHKLSSTQSNLQFQIDYRYRQSLMREQYPDALREWYLKRTGEKLNLENPQTYNEKIQWFKLYGVTPLITRLSDKYLVRDWVKERIGERYLIPMLGVWDKPEDINFDALPNQFVLKANHGCGFNMIVTDKSSFDIAKAVADMKRWLERDFAFWGGFEMQYHNIPRKIIAEKYIENDNNDLYDYKVWCFNEHAEYIMFLSNRKNGLQMSFYDRDWNLTPISYDYPRNGTPVSRPDNLQELILVAEKLAEGFAHVRVDFYRLNDGRLLFGEMTFTSGTGACKWDPPEYNSIFGNMIHYPGLAE